MRRIFIASAIVGASSLAGLVWASALVASIFDHQPALGAPLMRIGGERIYAPWAVLNWRAAWAERYPRPFVVADFILMGAMLAGAVGAGIALRDKARVKPIGEGAWASFDEVREAGLFSNDGCVLGKFGGELICYDGQGHQLLIGASRAGKGRGHVVPSLLAWPASALVFDVKCELADGDPRHGFPGTAGFRQRIGPVLRFAPTRADSAAFNPLFEVRKGPNEVRDIQNIVEILVDPQGDGRNQDFWDRSAKSILVGVILHVLYAEPPARKTLAVVREKLRDLDATAQVMKSTLHRLNPNTNAPEVHPEVLHAAESFLAGEERLQSGVKATAESFFGLFADEIVANKTATSDFRIGDLMCGQRPVTLYLQPPPSDAPRLMPLLRLIVNQIARSLMEHQTEDAQGRVKRHRLLVMLDEFPMLGRMPFFEVMMGGMASYGLKASLVCQSLNHIIKAYGRENVILDNCHVVTAFAAADADTAKRISEMAGEVWELRESETIKRPQPILGWRVGSRTVREERRPLILPAQVRSLPRDDEIIFVSGAKPIRAKKVKFDHEPLFRARLVAAPRAPLTLTSAHDWRDVRALGLIPKAPPAQRRSRPASERPQERPSPPQPDLFTQRAARPPSISEQALAGFRGPDGEILPPPSAVTAQSAPSAAPPPSAPDAVPPVPAVADDERRARRARARGI